MLGIVIYIRYTNDDGNYLIVICSFLNLMNMCEGILKQLVLI